MGEFSVDGCILSADLLAFPDVIVEGLGGKFSDTKMPEGGFQQSIHPLLRFVQVSPIIPAIVVDNQLQQGRHVDALWASRVPTGVFGEFALEQFNCFGMVGTGRFPVLLTITSFSGWDESRQAAFGMNMLTVALEAAVRAVRMGHPFLVTL